MTVTMADTGVQSADHVTEGARMSQPWELGRPLAKTVSCLSGHGGQCQTRGNDLGVVGATSWIRSLSAGRPVSVCRAPSLCLRGRPVAVGRVGRRPTDVFETTEPVQPEMERGGKITPKLRRSSSRAMARQVRSELTAGQVNTSWCVFVTTRCESWKMTGYEANEELWGTVSF